MSSLSGDLGGAEFVSFLTAINVATASWEQFQNKLRHLERRCEEIASDGLLEKLDQEEGRHSNEIELFVVKAIESVLTKPLGWVNSKIWGVCYILALLSVVVGILMLYLNTFCPWEFLLLLPTALYLLTTAISLFLVRILTAIVCWILKITPSNAPNEEDLST